MKNFSLVNGTELKVSDTNVCNLIWNRSRINCCKVAIKCLENERTFKELKEDTKKYTQVFMSIGIKKGDIVPICLPPCIEAVEIFLALNQIGAISTFLDFSASKQKQMDLLNSFHSKYYVISSNHSKIFSVLIDECEDLTLLVIRPQDSFKSLSSISELTKYYLDLDSPFNTTDKIINLNELFKQNYESIQEVKVTADNEALIAYTSGTTGDPKAIVLTNRNIIASLLSLRKSTAMQFGPRNNSMQVVPFSAPYGFITSVLIMLFVGKTVALTPTISFKTAGQYILFYKPSYILAIPSFYKSLLQDPILQNQNMSYLKYAISGGDRLDAKEKKIIKDFLLEHKAHTKICDGSGCSEGCGCLTYSSMLIGEPNFNSVGKPIYGLSIKFIDENGNIVPIGSTGKFCFAGQICMKEYYNDGKTTSDVLFVDKDQKVWFHTDTFGHIDKNGWVYLDGRERRFFITYDTVGSPYKVYSDYIQDTIKKCDKVLDCAVVQMPDSERSLVSKAYLVLKPSESWENVREKVKNYCEQKLQRWAIPVCYERIDRLPLTNTGKIDYRVLEEQV